MGEQLVSSGGQRQILCRVSSMGASFAKDYFYILSPPFVDCDQRPINFGTDIAEQRVRHRVNTERWRHQKQERCLCRQFASLENIQTF